MKKFVLPLGLLLLTLGISCKKDVPVPPSPVPAQTPAVTPPATPPVNPEVPKVQDASGTSVSVSKDGIDVKTKSEKTKVRIDGTGAAVEVKK